MFAEKLIIKFPILVYLFLDFIVFIPAEKIATNSSASFINFSNSVLLQSMFKSLINSNQNKTKIF